MVLETVPRDPPLPSCEEPAFWKQKYFSSRHTVPFKFQNTTAGSNVTSGVLISILLFSNASLAWGRFWERFPVCRTRALHPPSPGTNTSITVMPRSRAPPGMGSHCRCIYEDANHHMLPMPLLLPGKTSVSSCPETIHTTLIQFRVGAN